MLYKEIDLDSGEPVLYVGVYVLKWGKAEEPTVGFRPATEEEVLAEVETLKSNRLADQEGR